MRSIAVILLLIPCSILAQNNLVKNPGFEEIRTKPSKVGDLNKATGWVSPTQGTADLFHQSAKNTEVQVPSNNLGYQEAHDGEGYAGAIFYSRRDDQREYLMGELTTPLESGETYCVEFYVSAADLGKYAITQIGAYFTNEKIQVNNWDPLPVKPDVQNHELRVLPKQDKWQIVCGQFEANGGETFIVIGNFVQKDDIEITRLRKPRGTPGVPVEYGYYYIDDVSVVHIDEFEGNCGCQDKIAREEAGMNIVYSKVIPEGTDDDGKIDDMSAIDILETKSIYFSQGAVTLLPQSTTDIKMIVNLLVENPKLNLEIIGYADTDESLKDGGLADKRANEVRTMLIKGGINADRLKVVKGNPLISQSAKDEPSKARVRRIDFSVETD